MNVENPSLSKEQIREKQRQIRKTLSSERRAAASKALIEKLFPLSSRKNVLSFAPFGDEVDIWPLNQEIEREGQLFLPRVVGEELHIFRVDQIAELEISKWGVLEPVPSERISPEEIDLALVPGLAFGQNHHRLGYGLGFYDRLIPTLLNAHCIGIGFLEEEWEKLPIEEHDAPLDEILLR